MSAKTASQSQREPKRDAVPTTNPFSKACLWCGRGLALALIAASPWYYGLAHWQAQLPMVLVVAVVFLLALFSGKANLLSLAQTLRTPEFLGLLGFAVLAAFQTIPLPESVWQAIAPGAKWERLGSEKASSIAASLPVPGPPLIELNNSTIDPNEAVGESLRFPRTLSLHPLQTRASLSVLAGAILFALASSVLFRGASGGLSLLITIAITTSIFALVGVAFELLGTPAFFSATGFSTLISKNSSPPLLAIGFGALAGLLSWWQGKRRRGELAKQYSNIVYQSINPIARLRRRIDDAIANLDATTVVIVIGLTFHFVAIFATMSRGGIVGFFCAAILAISLPPLLAHPKNATTKVPTTSIGLLLAVAIIAIFSMQFFDFGSRSLSELNTISQEAHERGNARFSLWRWSLSEPAYWLTGAGLGTFRFAIVPCYPTLGSTWFAHAESVYVEAMTEFGMIGGILFCSLIVVGCFIRIVRILKRNRYNELLVPAALFALLSIGVQSLVDFSLIIPAIFLPLTALFGAFTANGEQTAFTTRKKMDARQVAAGKKNEKQESPTPDDRQPKRANLSIFISLAMGIALAIAMGQGIWSLRGFAAAEKLEQLHEQFSDDSNTWSKIQSLAANYRSSSLAVHPELLVQIGRLQQQVVNDGIENSLSWPKSVSQESRKILASPELVAAAVRGGATGRMAELKPTLDDRRGLVELLGKSRQTFRQSLQSNPLDWRAHWGILRGNLDNSPALTSQSYAMLQLTGRHNAGLFRSAGMMALLAGESEVGVELLRTYVEGAPDRAMSLTIFVELLSAAELAKVVTDPIVLCKYFEMSVKRAETQAPPKMVNDLAMVIDLDEAESQSSSGEDWSAIAAVAEWRDDFAVAADALQRAISHSPFEASYRYRLAKSYEKLGQLSEAIEALSDIGPKISESSKYRKYLEELKQKLAPSSPSMTE